jgi:hypothetical protein
MSFTLGMSEGEKLFMAKAVAEATTMLQLLLLLPLLPFFVVGDDRPWLGCCFVCLGNDRFGEQIRQLVGGTSVPLPLP